MSMNQTSFWSARVALPSGNGAAGSLASASSGLWDNPLGNPTPPDDPSITNWKRQLNSSPPGVLTYSQPIQYQVRKTGYYCVAMVPVTLLSASSRAATDVPYRPTYTGNILFQNTFKGKLPATDYPKTKFYLAMFIVYTVFAAVWGALCYKKREELLPIQYYLSSLVGFLVIEMIANWAYYRYLNAHGKGTASTVFLIVGEYIRLTKFKMTV